jgi:hypothetical protein
MRFERRPLMAIDQKYRPVPEHRRVRGRTAPATISVRTHFMYSEPAVNT